MHRGAPLVLSTGDLSKEVYSSGQTADEQSLPKRVRRYGLIRGIRRLGNETEYKRMPSRAEPKQGNRESRAVVARSREEKLMNSNRGTEQTIDVIGVYGKLDFSAIRPATSYWRETFQYEGDYSSQRLDRGQRSKSTRHRVKAARRLTNMVD